MAIDPNIDETSETAKAKTKGFMDQAVEFGVADTIERLEKNGQELTPEQIAAQKAKRAEKIEAMTKDADFGDTLIHATQGIDWHAALSPARWAFAGAASWLSSNPLILDRLAREEYGDKIYGRVTLASNSFSSKSTTETANLDKPPTALDEAGKSFKEQFPEAAEGTTTTTANLDSDPSLALDTIKPVA